MKDSYLVWVYIIYIPCRTLRMRFFHRSLHLPWWWFYRLAVVIARHWDCCQPSSSTRWRAHHLRCSRPDWYRRFGRQNAISPRGRHRLRGNSNPRRIRGKKCYRPCFYPTLQSLYALEDFKQVLNKKGSISWSIEIGDEGLSSFWLIEPNLNINN